MIISGRRKKRLEETIKANPGMSAVELNVQDPASIKAVAKQLIEKYPDLNVLFNNAGIMMADNPAGVIDHNPGPNEGIFVTQLNNMMSEPPKGH